MFSATIVTNGGISEGKGYYHGVTIAVGKIVIPQGRRVAHSDLHTMCSILAEVYGFLAGLALLNSLLQQVDHLNKRHILHTNSTSLLS